MLNPVESVHLTMNVFNCFQQSLFNNLDHADSSSLREERNEIRLKRIRQLSNDLITDQTLSGYMVKRLSAHGGCLGSQRR